MVSPIFFVCCTALIPTINVLAAPASLRSLSQESEIVPTCRCFPPDRCWPSEAKWNAFNDTLNGKLLATKPLASVCHQDQFAPLNARQCAELQSEWTLPETHYTSSSSIMAPFFANRSCDPFFPENARCILGTYVQYAVNATEAADYQKTITFVNENNIRLVIRNTGHDYFGKSTGAGALAIWTHNIKSLEFSNFSSPDYTGSALKMGAGIQVFEAYAAAQARGFVIVGGFGPSVGVAGGYTQGGGHGPLSSRFGLAADQVLEWEVVTGTGELLTASLSQNIDLYWALSGGGGGTYGVVLSLTVRTYPDQPTTGCILTFNNTGISQDVFFNAVEVFIGNLPAMVDAGAVSVWLLSNTSLSVAPTLGLGVTKTKMQDLFLPTTSRLNETEVAYSYLVEEFPTFLDSYNALNPPTAVADIQIGGRLIPRSVVESENQGLTAILRNITESGALIEAISLDVSKNSDHAPNSVNPRWRDTIFNLVVGTLWNNTDDTINLMNQRLMTDEFIPQLKKLTPNGGAYINEADPQQPDFQQVLYGENYDTLKRIKDKYDPEHIFYGLTAVGSEYWTESEDGRLCMTSMKYGTSSKYVAKR